MDKPWFKSYTVLSAVVYAALQSLEDQGVVPAGAVQSLVELIKNLVVVVGAFGLRRAIG